ncbi:DUF7133 domain-containing protein [Haloferula sp.]|uniref:DUF7133 domain-containing protein n=1 Tax=Haloferula sp. TaxID=2497595 RepID=UPI00329DEF71
MIRPTILISLLTLSLPSAGKDPHADGLGGDPLPKTAQLQASESVAGMTIPEGIQVRVAADHEGEGVFSPTALTFDEKGALYISETHRFRMGVEDNRGRLYWVMDDIASQTVEDRATMYEKWREKAPLDKMTEHSEVVRKLSDPGEDGRFKKSEVFADAFNDQLDGTAAGIFAYEGTVFLANIPKIYALRDNDGDGKAEIRETIADGFGVRVSLSGHDLNGFTLGPDGRLYGTIGDRGFNVKTEEGKHFEYPDQGAVFRFEPDGTNFEVIHTGLRNPKEIAFDDHGNAFTVDNNSDQKDKARIVYIVDGGDSGWRMDCQTIASFFKQIGLDERPPNAWMGERMWEPQNEDQPAWILPPIANLTSGPSGLTYHPGTGFLESEAGRFLVCDYRGIGAKSGVWSFEMAPKGAGMRMVDARALAWGVAATDVEYSWDGRVFITDFVSGWISHEEGRILELSAGEPFKGKEAEEVAKLVSEGFAERPVEELEGLLAHADMRVRTRAQLALTRLTDGMPVLERVAKEGEGLAQLHAIWGLGVVARRGGAAMPKVSPDDFVDLPGTPLRPKALQVLLPLLDHGNPEVRAQTIRMLGDCKVSTNKINYGALLQDSSARVRMFAAISAGKSKAVGMLSYIWNMIDVNDDQDPYLRHAGIFAMKSMAHPMQLMSLRSHESAAVRKAAVIALGQMGHERVGDYIGDADPKVSDEAIRMIHDLGVESVRHLVAALTTAEVERERTPMMWRRILHSAYRLGDEENLKRLLEFALNEGRPEAARREALRLLAEWNNPHPVDQSLGRLAPLPARDAAVSRAILVPKSSELMLLSGSLIGNALKVAEKHRLDISSVPAERFKEWILNPKMSDDSRLRALSLYVDREPEGLDGFLLQVTQLKSEAVAKSGLARLFHRESKDAMKALLSFMDSDDASRRRLVWPVAADYGDKVVVERFVRELKRLTESEGEREDAIELLKAAKAMRDPQVEEALANYETKIGNSDDPLAAWKPALLGGDAEEGKLLFKGHPAAQCSRCHEAGSAQAGPVLDEVANRGDRRFLLESLVNPAAQVTPGFGMVAVTLKDGSSVGGMLSEETPEKVVLDLAGKKTSVLRSEIAEISEPISSMPPMGGLLTMSELRDLVAWLSEQKRK